jgi:hypothetical protein
MSFGLAALAGLAMGVAPSSLPLFSVVMGTTAARREPDGPVDPWGEAHPAGSLARRPCP